MAPVGTWMGRAHQWAPEQIGGHRSAQGQSQGRGRGQGRVGLGGCRKIVSESGHYGEAAWRGSMERVPREAQQCSGATETPRLGRAGAPGVRIRVKGVFSDLTLHFLYLGLGFGNCNCLTRIRVRVSVRVRVRVIGKVKVKATVKDKDKDKV